MTAKTLLIVLIAACLVTCFQAVVGHAQAQTPTEENPSPELIGELTKGLSITPKQASGGAGALFGLAKGRLSADQFGQIAAAVPGMDKLLNAAPKSEGAGALGSLGSAVPGGAAAGGATGLASTAGAFKKLGLSPEMASQFVPVLTKFVESKAGSNIASLLAGALGGQQKAE